MLSILLASANNVYTQTVWTGSESSDWFDSQNWTNGLPASGNNAAIPSTPPGDFLPSINQNITIDFTIENDNILTLFANVMNMNSIINYEDGSIINYGIFDNKVMVDNDGEFYSAGNIINSGDFDNSGTIQFDFGDEFRNTPDGRLYNYGPIKLLDTYFVNRGAIYINGGSIETSGSFKNFGLIQNNGLILNGACGIFKNLGDINNSFTIENANLFYNEGFYTGNPVIDLITLENNTGITQANYECTDKNGWTHYYDSTNSKIMLSIFTDGIDIGSVSDQTLIVETNNDLKLGTGTVNNFMDALYPNCDEWYTMNRSWNIKSSLINTTPFKVRFYYNNSDYDDIQNSFPISQNIQELVFFKLNESEDAFDPDVAPNNTASYELASSSSPTNWSNHEITFSKYAEIETTGLDGAYGAGVKSWLGGTIPFQLTFDAIPSNENKSVDIEWSTGSESLSESYTLQKSDDGISFTNLETIPAQGNTIDISEYSEVDEDPNIQASTFYRIKLKMADGNVRFSAIREVKFETGEISIYPNPSSDELFVKFSDLEQGEVTITIYDMNGHKIYADIFEVSNNTTTANLYDKTTLGAGIYSLQVNSIGKNNTYRFIKVSR